MLDRLQATCQTGFYALFDSHLSFSSQPNESLEFLLLLIPEPLIQTRMYIMFVYYTGGGEGLGSKGDKQPHLRHRVCRTSCFDIFYWSILCHVTSVCNCLHIFCQPIVTLLYILFHQNNFIEFQLFRFRFHYVTSK